VNDGVQLRAVKFDGYKSLDACEVDLPPLCFVIGRNGVGKTNFADAISFVGNCLNSNLENAVAERNSIGSVLKLGSEKILFRYEFESTELGDFAYELILACEGRTSYYVESETIANRTGDVDLRSIAEDSVAVPSRALALQSRGSNDPHSHAAQLFLRNMRRYDFNIPGLRPPQQSQVGELLRPNGSNLASVIQVMLKEHNARFMRVLEYMRVVLPNLKNINVETSGEYQVIRFEMEHGRFSPHHVSSGTLLSLATLVALFQPPDNDGNHVSLVSIEEPERSLHPGAVGVLHDAMVEASNDRQVLATTQSADLLDNPNVETNSLRVVITDGANTHVGNVASAAREMLSRHLFTVGELVRMDQFDEVEDGSEL